MSDPARCAHCGRSLSNVMTSPDVPQPACSAACREALEREQAAARRLQPFKPTIDPDEPDRLGHWERRW